jgi:hypothetical protein
VWANHPVSGGSLSPFKGTIALVSPRDPQEAFNRSEQQLLNTIAALTANTVRASN